MITSKSIKEGGRTPVKNERSRSLTGSFWPENTLFPWKQLLWKYIFSESSLAFPCFPLNLRLGSSGVCQVSAPAQASYILSEKPIVIQRKLMIQQVLDVWSPKKQLPGIWTIHCWLTTVPAPKCFPYMSSHLTPTVAGLACLLGLMREWNSQQGWYMFQGGLGIHSGTQVCFWVFSSN